MLFNTWFGQVRPHSAMPDGYYFRPRRPVGRIQLRQLKQGGYNTEYFADKIGNMDIKEPMHIRDMMGLGYPVFDHYTGWVLPSEPVQAPMTDGLIYANQPGYDRKLLEALNKHGGSQK